MKKTTQAKVTKRLAAALALGAFATSALWASGCTGRDEKIEGVLEVTEGETLQLKETSGELITVHPGKMLVTFETGVFGVTDPSVIFNTAEGDVRLRVPREAVNNGQTALSAKEADQPVGIEISTTKDTTSQTAPQKETRHCAASGVCSGCHQMTEYAYDPKSGSQRPVTLNCCGYGLHPNCQGIQTETVVYSTYNGAFTARFIKDGKEIAVFRGTVDQGKDRRILDGGHCELPILPSTPYNPYGGYSNSYNPIKCERVR